MIGRILAFIVMLWLLGFMAFGIFLPKPVGAWKSDAVIVYTGGEGRIDRGIEALRKGWSSHLLVAGVDRDVKPGEFRAEYRVPSKLMRCCVTLDHESYDTVTNAREASDWLADRGYKSVRLITSDWHMRRAAFELGQVKPDDVVVVADAVHTAPSMRILVLEYHKYVLRTISWIWDR